MTKRSNYKKYAVTGASLLVLSLAAGVASAEAEPTEFDIKAQSLSQALLEFNDQSGAIVVVPQDLVNGKTAPAIVGTMEPDAALDKLLVDTGLQYSETPSGAYTITLAMAEAPAAEEPEPFQSAQVDTGSVPVGAPEDAESDAEGRLDTIVVTAQKREQSIRDVPISIAALGNEELADRGIDNLSDLAATVPGLTVQNDGGNSTRVTIRGIGASGGFSAALIGFYLDDISVSGNPAFNLDLRAYDLERVEVLRGPQGTLYGDGSVGGTIRYITKKPELDRFSALANLEAAGTQDGAPSFKTQGVANIPLIEDVLGLRIAGTFDHAGGWIDQPVVGNLPDRSNINSSDVINIRTNLLWNITDRFDASGLFLIHRNDGNMNNGENSNGEAISPFGFTGDRFVQDDYEIYGLTLNYDLGFADLVSASSYINAKKNFLSTGELFLAPPPSTPLGTMVGNDVDREVFNQELRLVSSSDGPLNWLIGGNLRDRNISQAIEDRAGLFDGPIPAPFVFSQTEDTRSFAIFGEASYQLFDWLEFGGGLRYFEDDRSFQSSTVALQSAKFDALTGRAFIRVALSDEVNAYASFAEGFRSGGINPVTIPPFQPENTQTYELGLKGAFFDGRMSTELALFHTEIGNAQLPGIDFSSFLFFVDNGGNAELYGLEGAVSLKLTDDFRIDASGSYIDSEFVSVSTLGSTIAEGDRLPFAPGYNFSVSPVYDFSVGDRSGFVRLDYSQAGRSYNYGFFETSSDVINMLNANIQLNMSENVSVGLFGSNLLNDRGLADAFGIQASSTRNRPRTIGVRFTIQN